MEDGRVLGHVVGEGLGVARWILLGTRGNGDPAVRRHTMRSLSFLLDRLGLLDLPSRHLQYLWWNRWRVLGPRWSWVVLVDIDQVGICPRDTVAVARVFGMSSSNAAGCRLDEIAIERFS